MAFDILTWHLTQEDIPLTKWDDAAQAIVALNATVTYVDVRPVINGQLVNGPSEVFDTLAMFVRQHIGTHRVDLWTCGCGVAGCAGIHDDMYIEVTEHTVSWHVPREEPFIRVFETTWFAGQLTNWKWTFSKEQYSQAIAALKAQLLTLESTKPVVLWRDEDSDSKEPLSLTEVWATSQEHYYKYKQRELDFQNSWGILHNADIKTRMGDVWYVISAQSIVSEAAEYLFEDSDEQRNWTDNVALPKLRETPELIYELAANLTYDLVSHGWWLNLANQNIEDPSHISLEQRQNYWLDAHRELVFDDLPRSMSVS